MKRSKLHTKISNAQIKALIVFTISLIISQIIALSVFYSEKEKESLQVRHESYNIKNCLENSLNHSITATKMLCYIVENDLLYDNFDTIARVLLKQNKFIDAIQLVKDSTIIKTYPLKGNEATIGYTVLHDPMHRAEAFKAYKRRQLYFEGPFNLHQGGVGIVGRTPIFKNDSLWGFSAVVIRMETLLKALNMDESGSHDDYVYQIEKQTQSKQNKSTFFKTDATYNTGIFHKTSIPLGDWILYVKLKDPSYISKTMLYSLIGMAFSLILTFYILHLSTQPAKLRKLVRAKTIDLENANKSLEKRAQELLVSNKELEQFAYVASHDLQEPLRMITGFLSQLEKKYSDKLDDKAKQYIHFAVDGAKRMRQIILDLLEFSKIGRLDEAKEQINITKIIEDYTVLRDKIIQEKSATIQFDNLPEITSYKVPIQQIFHNLIDNSLKYSREGIPPMIIIRAVDKENYWQFSIKDNGIGIEENSFDKIFLIFKRLHNSQEYAGTGIGLAIVKKIVDNLNGKIWVESKVEEGSTFYFTMKKND